MAQFVRTKIKFMTRHLLWRLPLLAVLLTGCTRHYDTDVISLPCGPAQLVVHERYTRHFSHSTVRFELRLVTGRQYRLVDELHTFVSLYVRPAAAADYQVLRTAPIEPPASVDPAWRLWAVHVSPHRFSRAEYEQIYQTLASNLPAIDAAFARQRGSHVWLDYERQARLVSTRYTDCAALRKVYVGPEPFRVEVDPVGGVTLQYPHETISTMRVTTGIGLIVDNGKTLLALPAPTDGSSRNWSWADVRQCRDERGRTVLDDFTLVEAEDEYAYIEARARQEDRESAFHEFTTSYVKTYRHLTHPFRLQVRDDRGVVVTGTLDGEPMRRLFGFVVEGGTALLLPPPDGFSRNIITFHPIPGIPDRQTFAAACRDENGRSPLADYRLVLAADEADYRQRIERARTGADRR
jgi:hypothetical protein